MSAPAKKAGRPGGTAVPYLRLVERKGRKPQYVIFDATDPKKPVQEPTGTADRGRANACFLEYLTKKAADPGRVRIAMNVPIQQVVDAFWASLSEDRKTLRAQRLQEADGILMGFWGAKTITEITEAACKAYKAHRAGIASGTVRGELKRLKTVINGFRKKNGMTYEPQWWLPEKSAPREEWFKRREVARLICAARGRTWDAAKGDWRRTSEGLIKLRPVHRQTTRALIRLILLGVFTGTRGDAMIRTLWYRAMRNDQPFIKAAAVERRPIYHRRGPAEPESRNKRRPPARICRELFLLMRRWEAADAKRGCALVIPRYAVVERLRVVVTTRIVDGEAVYDAKLATVRDAVPTTTRFAKETDAGEAFRALRTYAGFPKATIHALRHTCATWLLEYAPIEAVAAFLGLTINEVEDTYAKHDPKFTAPAARALNEWGRAKRRGPTGKGHFPKAA